MYIYILSKYIYIYILNHTISYYIIAKYIMLHYSTSCYIIPIMSYYIIHTYVCIYILLKLLEKDKLQYNII